MPAAAYKWLGEKLFDLGMAMKGVPRVGGRKIMPKSAWGSIHKMVLGASGFTGIGRVANWSPAARHALTGAAVGGVGGALLGDDSFVAKATGMSPSIWGGALGGALIGAGIGGGQMFHKSYSWFRGAGASRGRAAAAAYQTLANQSKEFIGSSYTKAYNAFSGMKGRMFGGRI